MPMHTRECFIDHKAADGRDPWQIEASSQMYLSFPVALVKELCTLESFCSKDLT